MQLNRLAPGRVAATRRVLIRAGAVAALAVLSLPLALLAHAHLRRSDPAAGERLIASPTAIRLWFTERPELAFTRVRLRAADSTEIPLDAATRTSDDPDGVALAIPTTLAAGKYTVLWRTAAADGHATTGSFTFAVAESAKPTVVATDSTARVHDGHALVRTDTTDEAATHLNVSATTRWLEFLSMLAVVGAVVFRLVVLRLAVRIPASLIPPETRMEISDSVRRLAQSALVVLLITALSRLYGEASAMLGPDRPLNGAVLRSILFGTRWGAGWLVGIAGIVVAAAGFMIVRRARAEVGWGIAALGALAIVITPALTGHASTTRPVAVALVADMLHVLAACAWLGALLALLFAAWPLVRGARAMNAIGSGPLVATLVRAFHPVALTCASIVIATGLVATWLRLPTVASLWESTYGRVLLLKLAFVAIVAVLGALNWRRLLPTLGDDRAARRITRTAGAELTVAVLVLAVTAVLVSTPPPDHEAGDASRVERGTQRSVTPSP
jgi:copper transport protein